MDQYKRTDRNPSLRRSVSMKVEMNEISQLKSEIILLKRQNERLLKKEKRLQVMYKYCGHVLCLKWRSSIFFVFYRVYAKNGQRNHRPNKILPPFIVKYLLPHTIRVAGSNIVFICYKRYERETRVFLCSVVSTVEEKVLL